MVGPRTATWVLLRTSSSVMKVPPATSRALASSQPGVDPVTGAVHVCDPADIVAALRCTTGATAATSGTTERFSSAAASSIVSVVDTPRP